MSLFGGGDGSWSTSSTLDPRFDMSGGANGTFSAMSEIEKAIAAKEQELGVKAPEDLEYGFMKD